MRRMLFVLLAVALLATPFAAQAQVFPSPGNPTVIWSDASITAVNSASEVSMLQYTIPPALIATTSVVPSGTNAPTYLSNANTQTWQMYGPQPLHFRALGFIAGGAGTTFNIGVNLQGSNASVTLNNNIVGAISGPGTPARLDVYVVPIATTSATPSSNNAALMLTARFAYVNSSGTETVANAFTVVNPGSTFNNASASILNVVGRWGAAASGSSATFIQRILRIGE